MDLVLETCFFFPLRVYFNVETVLQRHCVNHKRRSACGWASKQQKTSYGLWAKRLGFIITHFRTEGFMLHNNLCFGLRRWNMWSR